MLNACSRRLQPYFGQLAHVRAHPERTLDRSPEYVIGQKPLIYYCADSTVLYMHGLRKALQYCSNNIERPPRPHPLSAPRLSVTADH